MIKLSLPLAGALVATAVCAQSADEPIAVPGSGIAVRVDGAPAVSRDGGQTWQPLLAVQTTLHLRYAAFDPLRDGEPAVPALLRSPDTARLHIVQFRTQILDAYRADLAAMGAEIHQVLPEQGFVVRMDRATAADVGARPYVRWVGDYHPAYRLDESILREIREGTDGVASLFNVVMIDHVADRGATLGAIERTGGRAQPDSGQGILQVAELTLPQVVELARDDTVLWIDRLTEVGEDIDQARIQGGANYLAAVAGLEGKNFTGMIFEGVYNHFEFAAIPGYRTTPIALPPGNATAAAGAGHGTSTAGEVYAMGRSALYKGLAPFAQMLYCNYNYVINTNNRFPVTQLGVNSYDLMSVTASWGYSRTTVYDSRSAEMDDIIFRLDVPHTQSQSNSGNTQSRPQAWAKNIVSCGAVTHRNTANPADDGVSGTSTGPAQDGRIKPDMCGYYDQIGTTSGTTQYVIGFGGTSGATPIVNGYLDLAIEAFARGAFGHPAAPPGTSLFAYRPHAATSKAMIVNSAYQYPLNQIGGRYRMGWGFPDLQRLWDDREKLIVVDQEKPLLQGDRRDYLVFVPPGTREFRATMVYPDPPGTTSASLHRINSVDLGVVTPAGTQYWGNNGLVTSHFNTPGGAPNDRDTVENVYLSAPASGVYQVTVEATAVRQDGNLSTRVNDVDFALVVSGIAGSRHQARSVIGLGSSMPGDFSVKVANLPGAWAHGFTMFSAASGGVLGNGNWFGLEFDSLSLASLLLPAAPGNVFHFTNTPGQYPYVPYQFPAAIANLVSGFTFDGMALFFDGAGNVVDVTNTDRVTIQ